MATIRINSGRWQEIVRRTGFPRRLRKMRDVSRRPQYSLSCKAPLTPVNMRSGAVDNAAEETFFKTIKAALIWRYSWQTRRAVEVANFEYINGFFNPRRRPSARA